MWYINVPLSSKGDLILPVSFSGFKYKKSRKSDIERSLSHKGCPYDNAVAEATFKIIKTEFVWNETFADLKELKLKLWDYVNWYNHHRIHSSLGYQTPVQYRQNNLKKVV